MVREEEAGEERRGVVVERSGGGSESGGTRKSGVDKRHAVLGSNRPGQIKLFDLTCESFRSRQEEQHSLSLA